MIVKHHPAGFTLMGIEELIQEALNGPSRTLSRETVMQLKRERPVAGWGLQPRPNVHAGLSKYRRWSSANRNSKIEMAALI